MFQKNNISQIQLSVDILILLLNFYIKVLNETKNIAVKLSWIDLCTNLHIFTTNKSDIRR